MTALVMNPPKHAKGGKVIHGCAAEGCGRPARRRPTICGYPLRDDKGEHEWFCKAHADEWERMWAEADSGYREWAENAQSALDRRAQVEVKAA